MSKMEGHLIVKLLIKNTIKYDGGLDFYINWLLVELEATVLTTMADYKSIALRKLSTTEKRAQRNDVGRVFFLALLMSWRLKLPAVAGTIVYQDLFMPRWRIVAR
jgi:hypothetical protein